MDANVGIVKPGRFDEIWDQVLNLAPSTTSPTPPPSAIQLAAEHSARS
jgi:hypothetical protein